MPDITRLNVREIMGFEIKVPEHGDDWSDCRPAFKITLSGNNVLVLKGEMRDGMELVNIQRILQFGGDLMRNVSHHVSVEMCKPAELYAIRGLADRYYTPPDKASLTRRYLTDLIDSQMFVFYKMPFVENLKKLSESLKLGKGAKVLGKLKMDRGALFELGKVVAIDLFIGNDDRFMFDGRIANEGNIAFQKNMEKRYVPVGLDFYRGGEPSNLAAPPPGDWHWGGRALRDRQAINTFAARAIDSLNECFRRELGNNYPISMMLDQTNTTTFAFGITKGIESLKSDLLVKLRLGRGLPPGVVARMDLLGWN